MAHFKFDEAMKSVFTQSPRTTAINSKTTAIVPMEDTTNLRIIKVCGKSVRFIRNTGEFYYATNRVANVILNNPEVPVFVEYRMVELPQPSPEPAIEEQRWLCIPSRF